MQINYYSETPMRKTLTVFEIILYQMWKIQIKHAQHEIPTEKVIAQTLESSMMFFWKYHIYVTSIMTVTVAESKLHILRRHKKILFYQH